MTHKWLSCVALLASLACNQTALALDHEHKALTNLLQDIVVIDGSKSRVRYQRLMERQAELDAYLQSLSKVSRARFDEFSRDQQLAFLINVYNSFQLKQVIEHYPIASIKDVGSFFSSPWSLEFFTLFGEPASLDYVEHGLIRKLFAEPRIHFAVNCASISCPPLAQEAYTASRLDAQLDAQTRNFLQDQSANYLSGNTLFVSKIFDWYEEDFAPDVLTFIEQYRPDWFEGAPRIKYSDYNWNLNDS